MKKILFALCGLVCFCAAGATDLVATVPVRMTSDTATTAKTMAINDARRQILIDKLGQYSMRDQLVSAVRDAKSVDLTNLISETSIDGEQISDTTYSANITMKIDKNASRKWMNENNIQNWLSDGSVVNNFTLQITLSDPIADWINLKSIARAENVDLITKHISGNKVIVELPASSRSAFTIALRGAGWKTTAGDGFMRVWK